MSGAGAVRTETGRLVLNCAHREGWTPTPDGVRRCAACGVERYGEYGPLRLRGDTDHSAAPAVAA
ncbi:DUF6255 family natural product biosynthesis protein [Streptomyces huiliensis]|uniref:DUF6255 family natural product biosynthesis protein n=1 Tax=Streptomyces huiliensis TaxID=2876027 RepID=UPI001CBF8F62|nr:DUF6255 family natural product biosynthesis protein [Streptomyces huiliensis]MBZ4320608.1 hypothetical protein [Streptomyces huiliensis]